MSKTKVTIHVQSAGTLPDDNTILLGGGMVREHKIPTNTIVGMKFGASRYQVRIVSVPRFDGLRMSETMARRLGLHQGAQLRLKYRPGLLMIGPLIGIMVSQHYANPDRPFGAITSYCLELTEACRQQGAFVYFFTIGSLRANMNHVEGWSYSGRWNKSVFPIPDVVHNRLTSRKLENKPSVQHFMKEVKSRHSTSIFNEKYLDKTEVFAALRKEPSLVKYLPESYAFKGFPMLKSMCQKYSTVFLKPVTGSLGKGIIRISKGEGDSYTCHFTSVNGVRKQAFANLRQLYSSISGKLRLSKFQIQQGLRLIQMSNRNVDFRALTQKNGQGKWSVTSVVARIAGNNHFVSNVARGGTMGTVKETLPKTNLTVKSGNSSIRLKEASLEIAQGIERQIPYHFGELGIDLGLDTRGKVWLIEVNSKPSKNDNTPLEENKIRPSVKMMVQYARYLAGF